MVRMKSLISHTANQKMQEPGAFYEADEQGAKLARLLGWAEDAPTLTQTVIAAAVSAVRPRRQYKRRDMSASA